MPVQAHGSVVSCRVLCDHVGISKQVAFVQMETHQQALQAIKALHDTKLPAQVPAGATPSLPGLHACGSFRRCTTGSKGSAAAPLTGSAWACAQGPAAKALHVALAESKQDRQRKARRLGNEHQVVTQRSLSSFLWPCHVIASDSVSARSAASMNLLTCGPSMLFVKCHSRGAPSAASAGAS